MSVPIYMGQDPAVFYADAIRSRQEFSNYASSLEITYGQIMDAFSQRTAPNTPVYWLGGSRSWDALMRCTPTVQPTPLEAYAILPGNYDTFLLCNNVTNEEYKRMVQTMEFITRELVEQANNTPNTPYLLEIQTRNFSKNDWKERPGQCTLFRCHSIFVNVVGFKGRSTRGTQPVPEFKDKLLFYFEFGHVYNVNVPMFKEICLTTQCSSYGVPTLTLTGHLLFNEFLAQARLEKGLNVDRLRTDLLRRILVNETESDGTPQVARYLQLINTYKNIFGGTIAYNKPYYDKYIVERYGELILNSIQKNAYDETDAYVIEKLRPVLNQTLFDLYHSHIKSDAVMFLAGGDAVRRYLDANNQAFENVTKDIDVKIYYDRRVSQKAMEIAAETQIIPEVVALAGYLDRHKGELLTPSYTYTMAGYSAKIQFVVPSNQFRVRYFEATKDLPVYLISLDYRLYVQITIGTTTVKLHHDLAVLDIVLDKNPYPSMDALRNDLDFDEAPSFIPIPKIRFLLKDLETTYTTRSRAAARFWSGKNEKDVKRYTFLKQLLDEMFLINPNLSRKVFIPSEEPSNDIVYRINLMRDIIVTNHRKGKVRHKMPFIYEEEEVTEAEEKEDDEMQVDSISLS